MITILSPAKSLDFETQSPHEFAYTAPAFRKESETLIATLREKSPEELGNLMNLSENLAMLNYQRYQQWQYPTDESQARPAILAFKGDVYQGLQAETFTKEQMDFAQTHLRILSGLHGLLAPLDLILPYRLEMGTKLLVDKQKNLYGFWDTKIQEKLKELLGQHKNAVLVNLASNEYAKAAKLASLGHRVITPVFKERKGDKLQIVSFYAKKARGLMAAFIVKHGIDDPEALKAFDTEGYLFEPALSKENEWFFVRG